ncbi:hypothetical protein DFH06DRAFT_1139224 [Mycena polygramma]|nr:hypothetical protein DFH06DRAFT_1139224 [Mycena polygramma]
MSESPPRYHCFSLGHSIRTVWRVPRRSSDRFRAPDVGESQFAELFRFVFLGTIMETGRKLGETLFSFTSSFQAIFSIRVKPEFGTRDFAYDCNYLEHHRVWNESRSFKVVARNASSRPNASSALGRTDGHPDAIYEPAPLTPSIFRWKGYWISVNKTVAGYSHYDTGEEVGGTLSIGIWSRKRGILDEFVKAARQFYIDSKVLPRKVDREKEPSGSLMTAVFPQGDFSRDWMLAYLGTGPKDRVRYMPAHDTKQRFLYASPNTDRSTWIQVVVTPGQLNWNSHTASGGSITLILHSSDKEVLADLIDTAHRTYLEKGISKVTVHLTDNESSNHYRSISFKSNLCVTRDLFNLFDISIIASERKGSGFRGEWAKTVTKSRRELTTLILPTDIKETILADAREFLASEHWYNQAGIPHRRDGEPGTGKSSTIHALAGELGLEVPLLVEELAGLADIQGYLLTRKRDPAAAIQGVHQWLTSQEEEKKVLKEWKQKRKAETARKLKTARERADAASAAEKQQVVDGAMGGTLNPTIKALAVT